MLISSDSSLRWRQCGTSIGTTWRVVSNAPLETICDINTSVHGVYNGSGRTTRRESRMLKFAITDTRFLRAGRRDVDSVC